MLAATPGLARHLQWRHNRDRRRRGDRAWTTPDIIGWRSWLERLWEYSLVAGGPAGRLQLLNAPQLRHAIRLAADSTRNEALSNASPRVHRLLGRGWALIRDWDIVPAELAAAAANVDTRCFADWAGRFETLQTERGWVDAASLPATLIDELAGNQLGITAPIVLAGFGSATPTQARLFACLEDCQWLAGQLPADGAGKYPQARRLELAEPQDESRAAAHWARGILEVTPDACVGIIVPDPLRHAADFRRSFLDAFDPLWHDRDGATYPVGVSAGEPLANSGFVHTALLLLRITDQRLDFRDFGQLLRSPYVRGGVDEGALRARFDLRIRDRRMQVVDLRGLGRYVDDEHPVEFFELVNNMLALAGQLRERREPAGWLPVIEKLLKVAGLGTGRKLNRDEERVRDAWNRLLENLGSLGEVVGEVTFAGARKLLAEMAQEQQLRSTSRMDGAQIMSPWEADGHEFDAVWICDLTSESWPPVAHSSPLIPLSLQREHGIPEALPDVYRRQALARLDWLLACAPQCIVSWATRSGEEQRTPSPRLESLANATVEDFFDYRSQMLSGDDLSPADDVPPRLASSESIRGGTRLPNLQSACPARAFFELRLGAQELRQPPYALDAAARGNLLHDAAEILYADLKRTGGVMQASASTIAESIEDAIEKVLQKHVPANHPLVDALRANESVRLQRLLQMLVATDRERAECEVIELEGKHDIEIDGLPLKVRFDRVDQASNGAKLVIDYKTGARFGTGKWLGARPLDLQLPLYAAFGDADGIALFWVHSERIRVDGFATESFGVLAEKGQTKGVIDAEQWSAYVTDWRGILEGLIGEFKAGDCRIDLENDALACGQFAMLTRRWDISAAGGEE